MRGERRARAQGLSAEQEARQDSEIRLYEAREALRAAEARARPARLRGPRASVARDLLCGGLRVGAVAVREAQAAGETAGPLPPAANDVPSWAQARVISAEETCASLHARLTRTEQERSEALDVAHEADARVSSSHGCARRGGRGASFERLSAGGGACSGVKGVGGARPARRDPREVRGGQGKRCP